jgi:hypothetical protein
MAQSCVKHDDVERAVLERKSASVALDEREVRKVARKRSSLREENGRGIDPDDLADTRPGRQRPRDRPRPAPDLEDARTGRKVDVREIRLPHLSLLRVGGTKLEDVRQSLHDRRLGLGDGDVDIGHR